MYWLQWAFLGLLILSGLNCGYVWWFLVRRMEKINDCTNKEVKNISADGENIEAKIVRIKYLIRISQGVRNVFDASKGMKLFTILFNRHVQRLAKAVEEDWLEYTKLYKINPH